MTEPFNVNETPSWSVLIGCWVTICYHGLLSVQFPDWLMLRFGALGPQNPPVPAPALWKEASEEVSGLRVALNELVLWGVVDLIIARKSPTPGGNTEPQYSSTLIFFLTHFEALHRKLKWIYFIIGERRTSAVWQRSWLYKNYLSSGIKSEKRISETGILSQSPERVQIQTT